MTVLWLGLMVGSVHAQIKTVSGTVRDEKEYEKQTESQFHGV